MNQVQNESKETANKTLAIIGFIAVIIIGVWLAVQVIQYLPTAFSSLASLADGVYSNRPINTLTVSSEKNIANAGEAFQISWEDLNREGTYGFSYTCTDGVSLDVRVEGGDVRSLACGDILTLPDGVNALDIMIESEKGRFVDVPYTLTFTQIGEAETLFEKTSTVTIVNASIPQSTEVAGENTTREEPVVAVAEPVEEPVVETPAVTPAPAPKPAPKPTTIESSYTYFPTSDPNGFVDLKVTYLGVGTLSGTTFSPSGTIDSDKRGSYRFEVKNIGTKTSGSWTFDADLPNGVDFSSKTQAALKPNERAILTLGFDVVGEKGTKAIGVAVKGGNDTRTSNNSFTWSVKVN